LPPSPLPEVRTSSLVRVMRLALPPLFGAPAPRPADDDRPFMDATTSSWSDTKTSFKYGKFVLMFFHQLF
jgi:hypothetical protein